MAEIKPFSPVKLICGMIAPRESLFDVARERLVSLYGEIDLESAVFDFNLTDYYEEQMGKGLKRKFLSFRRLISPESLGDIKLRTNALEEEIRGSLRSHNRIINLDPGCLTASALIMATAKEFSHRVPLKQGIYAHLEFLFKREGIKTLDWTYPDFRGPSYGPFFSSVRKIYLEQVRRPAGD